MLATPEQIKDEALIVWLEDVSQLRYVREWVDEHNPSRGRRPRFNLCGRMVGYAMLRKDAKPRINGRFVRRIFWLKPYDYPNRGPYAGCDGGSPTEGVEPSSVIAGEPGRRPGLRLQAVCGVDAAHPTKPPVRPQSVACMTCMQRNRVPAPVLGLADAQYPSVREFRRQGPPPPIVSSATPPGTPPTFDTLGWLRARDIGHASKRVTASRFGITVREAGSRVNPYS